MKKWIYQLSPCVTVYLIVSCLVAVKFKPTSLSRPFLGKSSSMGELRVREVIEDDLSGDGGVMKEVVNEGSGDSPKVGNEVSVHYIGTLQDGTKFDSSRDKGTPFTFKLGAGQVINGWDVGVAAMKKGERSNLTIKSAYGYGDGGTGPIPGGATLLFDVELLDFKESKKTMFEMSDEEKLEAAQEAKEKGNDLFNKGDFMSASQVYSEGVEFIEQYIDWPTELSQLAKPLMLSLKLNLTNCHLKLKNWAEAHNTASHVLELDANNAKGFYRRGLANDGLLALEEAKRDLTQAARLEPKNADVRKELTKLKEKIQAAKSKEKETFGGMFNKMGGIYNEMPEVPKERDESKLPHVYLDIKVGDAPARRVEMVLFSDTVPKTAENFRQLCTGEAGLHQPSGKPLHFKNSIFHRIIRGFMAQGGDFTRGDGTGGASVYGEKFEDEAFVDTHDKRGMLSMANAGSNTNGSQFFITFGPTPHLDGKHVVFGRVVENLGVLDDLEAAPQGENDKPKEDIVIVECGEVK